MMITSLYPVYFFFSFVGIFTGGQESTGAQSHNDDSYKDRLKACLPKLRVLLRWYRTNVKNPEIRGLRICHSDTCKGLHRTCMQRDENAAGNMGMIYLAWITTGRRPSYLC